MARARARHGNGSLVLRSAGTVAEGTVENTNKRVRRYLPPETIVLELTSQAICSLCNRLNDTPRKCLGFQTPTEIFSQHLMAIQSNLV